MTRILIIFSPRHQIPLNAAKQVLSSTKIILGDEARHSRIVIVGGLAVMRLTNEYRTTTVRHPVKVLSPRLIYVVD
jgi:hypothetical protein